MTFTRSSKSGHAGLPASPPIAAAVAAVMAFSGAPATPLEVRAPARPHVETPPSVLPVDGTVVGGGASISRSRIGQLQINQTTPNAAINWQSFSIGAGASVVFIQPSSKSIALNRVTGNDVSQILGELLANGSVYLVNPNGIVFGKSATVDVAGLVASTANIATSDFMTGRLTFNQAGRSGAQVINQGQVTIRDGGLAAFVAPGVQNSGVISARLGKVALASGEAFALDPYGDNLVQLVVPASRLGSVRAANGTPLSELVNTGTIQADGGQVLLTAQTTAALVDNLINVGGTIRAETVENRNGRIVLQGDAGTHLAVTGTLDATGLARGEQGGTVIARAGQIDFAPTARIDARGDAAGGIVLVGGDSHGEGGGLDATTTTVNSGALIDVSAVSQGDGGKVVVWSDNLTQFQGSIVARGGAMGGDGGNVEVSGKQHLGFNGLVDAAAPLGKSGSLLLDPGSLLVESQFSGGGRDALPNDSAKMGTGTVDAVNTQSIDALLASGTSVSLSATEDITVADTINAFVYSADGRSLGHAGANLSLVAGGNLVLNGNILLDGGNFVGDGRTILQATSKGISTNGGNVSLTATSNITLGEIQTLGSQNSAGNLTIASTQGDVVLTQPLGGSNGRITVRTQSVEQPSLGQIDIRAPNGTIQTDGLLYYGTPSSTPLTPTTNAAAALGLNLQANTIVVGGEIFGLYGAINIAATNTLVVGSTIRQASGYPINASGGANGIYVYRPATCSGMPCQNTDVVVAEYLDANQNAYYGFFQYVNGSWTSSTDFLSVVMPSTLPATGNIPGYWIDRTTTPISLTPNGPPTTLAISDQAFTSIKAGLTAQGLTPYTLERLVSLPNGITSATSVATNPAAQTDGNYTSGLASYAGGAPYVPLVFPAPTATYDPATNTYSSITTCIAADCSLGDIPGTRFVPKVLITNQPIGNFAFTTTTGHPGVATTNIGAITLNGQVFEADSKGNLLWGPNDPGDLRNVALKIVSYDTQSIFQDSPYFNGLNPNDPNNPTATGGTLPTVCGSDPTNCVDNPQNASNLTSIGSFLTNLGSSGYLNAITTLFYPRLVYPYSQALPRVVLGDPIYYGSNTAGFQSMGYLSNACLATSGCTARGPATPGAYGLGDQANATNSNPNAYSTSLTWTNLQSPVSGGQMPFGQNEWLALVGSSISVSSLNAPFSKSTVPVLVPFVDNNTFVSPAFAATAGSSPYPFPDFRDSQLDPPGSIGLRINTSISQTPVANGINSVTIAFSRGVTGGAGVGFSSDGHNTLLTTLPQGSSAGVVDVRATPPVVPAAAATATTAFEGTVDAASLAQQAAASSDILAGFFSEAAEESSGSNRLPTELGAASVTLGGRGIAQNADLGRSGSMMPAEASIVRTRSFVACAQVDSLKTVALPPCQ